jgi:hypothetical protein
MLDATLLRSQALLDEAGLLTAMVPHCGHVGTDSSTTVFMVTSPVHDERISDRRPIIRPMFRRCRAFAV